MKNIFISILILFISFPFLGYSQIADLYLQDSLISTVGSPATKTWMEFSPLQRKFSHSGSGWKFMQSATRYPGVDTANEVFMIANNTTPGGGAEVAKWGGVGISMESGYKPTNSQHYKEFHIFFLTRGGVQLRAKSFTHNAVTNTIDNYETSSNLYIKGPTNGKTWFNIAGDVTSPTAVMEFTNSSGRVGIEASGKTVYFKNTFSASNRELRFTPWEYIIFPYLTIVARGIPYAEFGMKILPSTTNTIPLGSVSNRWSTVYAQSIDVSALTIAAQFTPASATDATYSTKTLTADDNFLYYKTSSGKWKKIAWANF